MPDGQDSHVVFSNGVVDVVTGRAEKEAPYARHRRASVRTSEKWRLGNELECVGQFVEKRVRGGDSVLTPPDVDRANLGISLGCGDDRQLHRRWRSSSRISCAGRRRPASADFEEANNASCSARRSSSVRSSPSSSATRSRTVPSGRVVGSFRTRRPFSTRARRGLMQLLYGLRRGTFKAEPPVHDAQSRRIRDHAASLRVALRSV